MKVLVLGAGMMGSAMAYDLAHSDGVKKVMLADIDEDRARKVAASIGRGVQSQKLDINYVDEVEDVLENYDIAIGATSYQHNIILTQSAIASGTHYCDLGGNMDVVGKQLEFHEKAKHANVLIIPNCGLAPGMACVIAAGAAKLFSKVEEIHIRVGGLPQHPQPPLNYQLVFAAEGLINEYIEPAEAIRDGTLQQVASMTDVEELEFPPPLGKLEAFNTSGGVSTLTRMFPHVKALDYKTIRYKGHCEKFRTLLDLGFGSAEPIMVGNGIRTARELFEELLRRKLPSNGPDYVLMRVEIIGTLEGSHKTLAYEMIDAYDSSAKMTSMMRTTAFPTSIIAQMIGNGTINSRGVMPPEQCVPLEPFLTELAKRKIEIRKTLT